VKVLVLALALDLGGIPSIVNGIEVPVFASAVHETDHTTPSNHSVLIATVLGSDQVNEAGIPFVVHAIIHDQTGVCAVLDPVFAQLPYLAGHKPLLPQEIVDHVVAHVLQMLGQRGADAVLGSAHQIFHVLPFGNHDRKMLFSALKRKSCFNLLAPREDSCLVPFGIVLLTPMVTHPPGFQ